MIDHIDGKVTVEAFAAAHGDWQHAFGYGFETPDRVIVISGDTRASRAVVEACDGCDILVHEAGYRAPLASALDLGVY